MNLPHWSTMFREADGSVSMTRVVLLIVTLSIMGPFVGLSIAHGRLVDIPEGPRWIFALAAGLKWGQIKHESDGPK